MLLWKRYGNNKMAAMRIIIIIIIIIFIQLQLGWNPVAEVYNTYRATCSRSDTRMYFGRAT